MNALRDRLVSDAESETPRIAAVMVDRFRVKAAPNRCLRVFGDLRQLCNETGCLLIADEVQIGVGRSGISSL